MARCPARIASGESPSGLDIRSKLERSLEPRVPLEALRGGRIEMFEE
jgi:hypothetical protein